MRRGRREHAMKLWKSTIVIWSKFNPCDIELRHLAGQAENGEAYCSKFGAEIIEVPQGDPDWDGTEFFGEDEGS